MRFMLRAGVAAGVGLLAGSCTTTTEVTLPALDSSKIAMAEAVVVQLDNPPEFYAPEGLVRGSNEGAANAMGDYLDPAPDCLSDLALSLLIPSDDQDFCWLWLLSLPVALPVSGAVGAGMAHSGEKVAYAVTAYNKVGQDRDLLGSIDRRVLEILKNSTPRHWACIEAASLAVPEPCAGYTSIARIKLRPAFRLESVGDYDPDIHFFGEVSGLLSLHDAGIETVSEVKWAYRDKLGNFFTLAENDASLLRLKLNNILDRFATRVVEDLYLSPQQEIVERKEVHPRYSVTAIPQGVVVRVGPSDVISRDKKTHTTLFAHEIGHALTACSEAEIPEKPWVGRWAARADNALLTLEIEEEVVRGRVQSGDEEFPIFGKVDEDGAMDASIFGRRSWDRMNVRGDFPVLDISYPVGGQRSPAFQMLEGKTVRTEQPSSGAKQLRKPYSRRPH